MGRASSLLGMLATDDLSRFMSPLPPTLDSFGRFVAWTDEQRAAGLSVCFVVVPVGLGTPVGVFQRSDLWRLPLLRQSGDSLWDRRAGDHFARPHGSSWNGALRKLGATPEGVLRRYFPVAREVSRPGARVDPRLRLDWCRAGRLALTCYSETGSAEA